jgi:aspartate aminotransferase
MPTLAAGLSRLGTETAFEVLARANALAAQGRDIVNLGIGQPDFRTPEHIVEAGRKALADGHHGYIRRSARRSRPTSIAATASR